MRFCSQCDNMYYLRLAGTGADDAEDKLVYYCRHCGHEDAAMAVRGVCALETAVHSQRQQYTQAVNAYTRDDPTLPRTTSIRCPSAACESNTGDGAREVVYLRYDDIAMRYLYICNTCGVMWKTSDQE
jgi:DNA-directed RNA polymerase subunit M/transcription elongation factor TFIIS